MKRLISQIGCNIYTNKCNVLIEITWFLEKLQPQSGNFMNDPRMQYKEFILAKQSASIIAMLISTRHLAKKYIYCDWEKQFQKVDFWRAL